MEDFKYCRSNNFHKHSKQGRIKDTKKHKNRSFNDSKSISPYFFRPNSTTTWPCRFAAGKNTRFASHWAYGSKSKTQNQIGLPLNQALYKTGWAVKRADFLVQRLGNFKFAQSQEAEVAFALKDIQAKKLLDSHGGIYTMFGLRPNLGEETDLTPARWAKVSRRDV